MTTMVASCTGCGTQFHPECFLRNRVDGIVSVCRACGIEPNTRFLINEVHFQRIALQVSLAISNLQIQIARENEDDEVLMDQLDYQHHLSQQRGALEDLHQQATSKYSSVYLNFLFEFLRNHF